MMVYCGENPMERKVRHSKKITTPRRIRASISFPPEMYKTLEGIAAEKKVSLAWVVREAVEKYMADKWPLFGKKQD